MHTLSHTSVYIPISIEMRNFLLKSVISQTIAMKNYQIVQQVSQVTSIAAPTSHIVVRFVPHYWLRSFSVVMVQRRSQHNVNRFGEILYRRANWKKKKKKNITILTFCA